MKSTAFRSALCLLSVLLLTSAVTLSRLRPFPGKKTRIQFSLVEFAPQEAPESPFDVSAAGRREIRGEASNRAVFASNTGIDTLSPILTTHSETGFVPENYTELTFSGCNYPVYTFIDSEGRFAYRVQIERSENGIRKTGFVEARPVLSGKSIRFEWDDSAAFVSVRDEDCGILSLADAPVESTAGLSRCWGADGLYCRTGSDGSRQYYFYGAYPCGNPGFVPADPEGRMIPGKLPVIYIAETEEPPE